MVTQFRKLNHEAYHRSAFEREHMRSQASRMFDSTKPTLREDLVEMGFDATHTPTAEELKKTMAQSKL